MTAVVLAGPTAAAAASGLVPAQQIVARLGAGTDVDFAHVEVVGALDLRPLRRVSASLRCVDCRVRGPLVATNVDFGDGLDLRGTTFRTGVDFRRAVFRRTALFARTTFDGPVAFGGATFEQEARFTGSLASRTINLSEVQFARSADFRISTLNRATFAGCRFGADADFTEARLIEGLRFTDVGVDGDALFRRASFTSSGRADPTSFVFVTVHGSLDFTGARFAAVAEFRELDVDRALTFADAAFSRRVAFDLATTADFTFPVKETARIEPYEARRRTLKMIERSAKDRDDFTLANDAFYELQMVNSQRYSWPRRLLDYAIYRGAAGYLVRPLHPIVALLAIVVLSSCVRTFAFRRRPQRTFSTRQFGRRSGPLDRLGHEIGRTLAAALQRPRWGNRRPSRSYLSVRGAELATYRILLICILLGLYADPFFRQFVDLLR